MSPENFIKRSGKTTAARSGVIIHFLKTV